MFYPHHVAFSVNNLDESIAWYEEVFGCTLVSKYKKNHLNIALLELDTFYIELFNFEMQTKRLPSYRKELMEDLSVVGAKHICFRVENIAKISKTLQNKGVKIVTKPDTTFFGGNYIFIEDCNGILIELYER